MNTKNLLIASAVGGVAGVVVTNTPYLGFVNCLLCIGFWGAGVLAAWLYRRLTGSLTMRQAVIVGTLAGVWAGVVGLLLSFVGLAGASGLMSALGRFVPPEDLAETQQAMSGAAGIGFTLLGVVVTIVFGAIGGLIAGAIFKERPAPQKS